MNILMRSNKHLYSREGTTLENKVFVYGSLKQGLGNHRIIKRYVRTVRNASMRGWMFNLGYYPAVVTGCGVVLGQLLELDHPDKAFRAMDILEGFQEPKHPRNLYERVKTSVILENGETEECFAYLFPDQNKGDVSRNAVFLPGGLWEGNQMQQRLYFAYGSCMSPSSFSETVPRHTRIGKAVLKNYRVGSTKYCEKWGGGVADLIPAPDTTTEGILYLLPEEEINFLNAREGANQIPPSYRRVDISIDIDEIQLPAFTYEVVAKSEAEIAPSDAYVNIAPNFK
jgi:gamma-glutamylcyclotransferase (GGCT)/AIG2-like uncharacterized protein YtfP/cation transport regulator ChaC